MTWWLSRSNDLSVIVEITVVWTLCDHNIKCFHNTMITVRPTDQYPWPTLRDSSCRLNFQYRSLLRQERLLISSLFTCVMLQVIEFSPRLCPYYLNSGASKSFWDWFAWKHLITDQSAQTEPKWNQISVVFYHLSSQLNLTSSITSHRFFLVDESPVSKLYTSFIT